MFKILIAVCVIAEAALLPYYLKLVKPGTSAKTLFFKMVCSTLFILTAVLSMLSGGNTQSDFAHFMLLGFGCSWVGDWLLHRKPSMVKYALGGLSFLIGHVCFILAYMRTSKRLFPAEPYISVREIAVIAVLWVVVVAGSLIFKLKFNRLAVPIFVYAAVLMLMLVKASGLGLRLMLSGTEGGAASFALLTGGALLFAVSDAILGIGFFGNKTYVKNVINIATYFFGQILLALTLSVVS